MKKRWVAIFLALAMVLTNTNITVFAEDKSDTLTETQKNSVNTLNYLTVLTQEINSSDKGRLYLEDAYSSLVNNTFPKVDETTESRLNDILDIIEKYRMIEVKRDRLKYIYEQNQAQSLKNAIPNPLGLLSAVRSFNLASLVTSVVYMAVDSVASYSAYKNETELQYLKDGWELDDEQAANLHNSRSLAFTYMLQMVRDYDIPGDLTLNEKSVEEFVDIKNNTNSAQRLQSLQSNKKVYEAYGPYWLLLAQTYYEEEDYKKCLESIAEYEKRYTRIYRKDYEYAKILPLAIVAAEKVQKKSEYLETAERYLKSIKENTDNTDWAMRYFAAQTYIDLYSKTNKKDYLQEAYDIVLDNVNNLVNEQKSKNKEYLAEVIKKDTPKDATKDEKKEIKEYNTMLSESRKKELPPVYEPLVLNCDLLFELAKKNKVSDAEKKKINRILRGDGTDIFLVKALDNKYRFDDSEKDSAEIVFSGTTLEVPAKCVSDDAIIKVTVTDGGDVTTYQDWKLDKVDRKTKGDIDTFKAIYSNKKIGNQKWSKDSKVKVEIIPKSDIDTTTYTAKYVIDKFLNIKIKQVTTFKEGE